MTFLYNFYVEKNNSVLFCISTEQGKSMLRSLENLFKMEWSFQKVDKQFANGVHILMFYLVLPLIFECFTSLFLYGY